MESTKGLFRGSSGTYGFFLVLDYFQWWFHFFKILLMDKILHQVRLVVFPIIYMVLYIPGGAGFLPSTVLLPVHETTN